MTRNIPDHHRIGGSEYFAVIEYTLVNRQIFLMVVLDDLEIGARTIL